MTVADHYDRMLVLVRAIVDEHKALHIYPFAACIHPVCLATRRFIALELAEEAADASEN